MSMNPRRIASSLPGLPGRIRSAGFSFCASLCTSICICIFFSICFSGCNGWVEDPEGLTARSAAPAAGPDCASCHRYPLEDRNHDYHLFEAGGNRDLNGKITCLDCHSQSVRSASVVLFDSLYETPEGEKYGTVEFPNANDTTKGKPSFVIRSLPLVRIDTLFQNHPVALGDRPGAKPLFQEYVTALAHMNRQVDVSFDARNSDTVRFLGQKASYNPAQETCSAVACHPGDKPYSFGSVAKGLPELKDLEE
jgi:hypothetical protein